MLYEVITQELRSESLAELLENGALHEVVLAAIGAAAVSYNFV